MENLRLRFKCPSCGRAFDPVVDPPQFATTVVRRTCRGPACREIWQLIVTPLRVREGWRMDKAALTYLGRAARGPGRSLNRRSK